MYIADNGNSRVRKVTASTGIISTVAGTGEISDDDSLYFGDGGDATSAYIDNCSDVALDASGMIFYYDNVLHIINYAKFSIS